MNIEKMRFNHKHEPGCGCAFDPMWPHYIAADPNYFKWVESLPTEYPEPEDFKNERHDSVRT